MEEDPADAVQPSAVATQTPVSPIDAAAPAPAGGAGYGDDQRAVDRAFDDLFGPDATTNSTATVLATRRSAATAAQSQSATAAAPAPARVRRYNPYAAIPYCIGFAIFALEAFLIV